MIPSFSNIHCEDFGEFPSSPFLYSDACVFTIDIFSLVFQRGFRTYHFIPFISCIRSRSYNSIALWWFSFLVET